MFGGDLQVYCDALVQRAEPVEVLGRCVQCVRDSPGRGLGEQELILPCL